MWSAAEKAEPAIRDWVTKKITEDVARLRQQVHGKFHLAALAIPKQQTLFQPVRGVNLLARSVNRLPPRQPHPTSPSFLRNLNCGSVPRTWQAKPYSSYQRLASASRLMNYASTD